MNYYDFFIVVDITKVKNAFCLCYSRNNIFARTKMALLFRRDKKKSKTNLNNSHTNYLDDPEPQR